MKKQGYIYKYTYSNGKVYIGQTRVSVKERHYQHMSDSKNKNRRQLCELAIAKYGEPQLDVVETIDFDGDDNTKFIEKLNKAEKKWIKKYESTDIRKGYNIQNGGNIKNLEKYLLEERWYEIFDNQKWGHLLAFYKELLNSIGHKICVTNEKLTDEEIIRILSIRGDVQVFTTEYKGFEAGYEAKNKDNQERLFLCSVNR